MIICPDCKIELKKEGNAWQCSGCEFYAVEENGILCFALDKITENCGDYKAEGLDRLYKYEQEHFWFKTGKRI